MTDVDSRKVAALVEVEEVAEVVVAVEVAALVVEVALADAEAIVEVDPEVVVFHEAMPLPSLRIRTRTTFQIKTVAPLVVVSPHLLSEAKWWL